MNPTTESFINLLTVVLLGSLLGSSIGMFVGNLSNDHRTTANFLPIFFVPFINQELYSYNTDSYVGNIFIPITD